ncbi:hypothetical protein [Pelagibacterium halotolerans]
MVAAVEGGADYWAKLATQTAGRNMPDIVQTDCRYLDEYVSRGAQAATR